ncbi:hypothetical protein HDU67_002502 [Dinochytrium kinnereticum]|nr:hypothetical protein HDU67_002502 [Dinochytrium kinnereticum]
MAATPAPAAAAGLIMPVPAIYSGVHVYEILCNGVPVMRRALDHFVNATQVLRAAGLPKTQRTKILERDVCPGIHEKIQGGYHMFQGTWVPLESAISLAKAHGLEEDMSPLFDFDPDPSDSSAFAAILEARKQLKLIKPAPKPKPVPARWSSTSSSWSSSEDDPDRVKNVSGGTGKRATRRPRQASSSPALPGTPPPLNSLPGPSSSSSASSNNRIGTRGKVYKPPGDLVEKRRPGRPKGSGRNASASQSPVPAPKKPRLPKNAAGAASRHSAPPGAVHGLSTPIPAPSEPVPLKHDSILDHMDSIDFDNMDLMDPYGLLDGGESSDSDYPYPPLMPGGKLKRPFDSGSRRRGERDGYTSTGSASGRHSSKRQRLLFSSSSADEDSYASFTDEDDLGDRSCEACGAITIPTWRKGPSGRRTLCDPCGLKWCFGRLPSSAIQPKPLFSASAVIPWDPSTSSSQPSDGIYDSDPESPSSFLMPTHDASTTVPLPAMDVSGVLVANAETHDVAAKLIDLKSRIQAVDRGRKRLRRLLDEMKREDAGADRAFRRAIVRCRRAKGGAAIDSGHSVNRNGMVEFSRGGEEIGFEGSDGEYYSVPSDDEDSVLEEEKEMVAVARFIQAVRWRLGS